MKKNLPFILVILVLCVVLFLLKYKQNFLDTSDNEFKLSNVDDLFYIEMEDKFGTKAVLSKKDKKWYVNDSILAQSSKMKTLLETINKLEIDFPLSDSMRQVAIEDLRKFGTKVILKDEDGNELKTIYVGNRYGDGNYMIISRNGQVSAEPYVVKLPGVKTTDLKYRFLAKPDAWFSTEVFTTPIDKIKQIIVTYTDYPQHSFVLDKDEELIQVSPRKDSIKINRQLNKENVLQFLLEFENKHFEGRINVDSIKTKIQGMKPYATISLTDVFDKKKTVILYRKPSDIMVNKDLKGEPIPFDLDKYWAYIPDTKDYVIAQHFVFGPILMTYTHFFEQEK